jgi:hypothetical protein
MISIFVRISLPHHQLWIYYCGSLCSIIEMLDKNNNFIIPSTFAFATLLISPLIIGGLQGAFSVYGATTFLFPSQSSTTYRQNVIQYDKEKTCASDQHTPTTWKTYLTHFACGHVTIFNNGTTLRQWHNMSITREGLQFPAWTFNGTIPGATLRMTCTQKRV